MFGLLSDRCRQRKCTEPTEPQHSGLAVTSQTSDEAGAGRRGREEKGKGKGKRKGHGKGKGKGMGQGQGQGMEKG